MGLVWRTTKWIKLKLSRREAVNGISDSGEYVTWWWKKKKQGAVVNLFSQNFYPMVPIQESKFHDQSKIGGRSKWIELQKRVFNRDCSRGLSKDRIQY